MDLKQTTNQFGVTVSQNALVDEGEGLIRFPNGLTLSDESEQANGTRYDHSTTDLSKFRGQAFADHGGMLGYEIEKMVGKWIGVTKQGGRIVAEAFQFAMKNPLGRLTYDLVLGGFVEEVSIGTYGPEPDDDGVYRDHVLKEASWVGIGNNENARLNSEAVAVAMNSIDRSEKQGLDVTPLRKLFNKSTKGDSMKQNQDDSADKKVEEKATEKVEEKKTETVEEPAPSGGDDSGSEGGSRETTTDTPKPDTASESSIAKMVENAVKPIKEKLDEYKQAFDDGAKEPEWQINAAKGSVTVNSRSEAEKQFKSLSPWELAEVQANAALKAERGDQDAAKTLKAINEMNLASLKKEGLVSNVLELADFGNFVTSPELQAEIVGYRTDYSEALRAFPYAQTNSRDFSFLTRSGDIDLDDVDGIDDAVGTDRLKPVKEYSGSVSTSRLQEMAAVTPISTTANLFLAADLIQDATLGYRNAADKRFAQLPIARLEQAMEADSARSTSFDATGSDTNAVKLSNIRRAIFSISQGDGVLVMTEASLGVLWDLATQVGASNALGETFVGDNPVRRLWGKQVVTVPNDLMPTLDDATTYRSIPEVRPLAGGAPVTVTVNHSIFYLPLSTWKGRTNGGLRFDVSADASYEVSGTVYSAFQRNEVVLRGAIFRGGAIVDPSRVRGVRAEAVIS